MVYQDPQNSQDHDRSDPECSICGDFGWVRMDVPLGHPSFGRAHPCVCQKRDNDPSRIARLQRYSNLGSLTRLTFENTKVNGRSDDPVRQDLFNKCYKEAIAFADDPNGWLVLTGPSGSGKTHLAAAVANRVVERGCPVFFIFVPDLLDHLRSTFSPSSDESYDQLFEQVRSAPFLILDDLGGHSSTPWAQEKLHQIVNQRYSSRMPTVFTIGVGIDELDQRWQTRLDDESLSTVCETGHFGKGRSLGTVGSLEPQLLHRMTFDTYDVRGNRASQNQMESLGAALAMSQSFAQSPEGWIVLLGPTGSGKTHLAYSIASHCIQEGKAGLYYKVADLFDYLRDTFNPDSTVTYDRLFQEVRTSPLLILEDFGTHHPTPWAKEKLYQILVHRHDARLPTVISMAELDEDKRSDPLISRLLDVTIVSIVPIDAPDFRYQGRVRGES